MYRFIVLVIFISVVFSGHNITSKFKRSSDGHLYFYGNNIWIPVRNYRKYQNIDTSYIYKIIYDNNTKTSTNTDLNSDDISDNDILDADILSLQQDVKMDDDNINMNNINLANYIPPFRTANFSIAMIPVTFMNKTGCVDYTVSTKFAKMMEYFLRIATGVQNITLFLPNKCFYCDDKCMKSDATYYVDYVWNQVIMSYPEYKNKYFSVTMYYGDHTFGGNYQRNIITRAQFISPDKPNNYYIILKTSLNSNPGMNNLRDLFYDLRLLLGYDFAFFAEESNGFLKSYKRGNYYGSGDATSVFSSVGNNGKYYQVPGAGHFLRGGYGGSAYPPWIYYVDEGRHVYRLLAWDHQLTRIYLDQTKYTDYNTFIDGIRSPHIKVEFLLPYNRGINTALGSGNDGSSIGIHYRFYAETNSHRNKGIRGDGAFGPAEFMNYGVQFMFGVDDIYLKSMDTNTLPVGYTKVGECDAGSLTIKVLKFHPIKNYKADQSLLLNYSDVVSLDDLPYVDIEIYLNISDPCKKPTVQVEKAVYDVSPTLFNCNFGVESDSKCDSYIQYYWIYMKPGNSRLDNVPRLSNENSVVYQNGRLGYILHPPTNNLYSLVFRYGADDKVLRRTTTFNRISKTSTVTYKSFVLSQCILKSKPTGSSTYTTLNGELNNYIIINDISVGSTKTHLTDIYKNKVDKIITTNGGFFELKPMKTQGFVDLILSIEDSSSNVIAQELVSIINSDIGNRIAIDKLKNGDPVISPAVLTDKFSCTSILGPLNIVSNQWYYFIFTNFLLDEYIYFDFDGTLPNDLIITIEAENGNYTQDISYLSNYKDITLKINVIDIAQQTGGWGEIYRYSFNKNIILLGIRPILTRKFCNTPTPTSNQAKFITLNNIDYKFECDGSFNDFKFTPFKYSINGREYNLNSSDIEINLNAPDDDINNGNNGIFVIHVSKYLIVVLLMLVIL